MSLTVIKEIKIHVIGLLLRVHNKVELGESDVFLGKTEVKQGKFVEFISPAKGYFRETYKSQNINPISLTPKFTLGIKDGIMFGFLEDLFKLFVHFKTSITD